MLSQPFDKKWHLYKKASVIMMLKIKKGIMFIFLLVTSICFSQNECIDFKNFEESQEWINKINKLDSENKKVEILKRVECESIKNDFKFYLSFIIEGRIFNITNIRIHDLNFLSKIDAKNYKLLNSLSCNQIQNKKNNIGFVLIAPLNNPISNEIKTFTFNKIKRKKKKIIFKIISEEITEIKIKREMVFYQENRIYTYDMKLKKGKNKIVLKATDSLNLIEIVEENKKSLIII